MSPKRASPLDEPPTASSSSEEEDASSEEEETSSDEDDEPAKPPSPLQPLAAEKKPTAKKPPPAAATITKPQPKVSSSESETESESGSDSEDDRPTGTAEPIVKPIASKPMEETPKAKKPQPQPSSTPARSATKRPSENNQAVSDSKRPKKGAKDTAGGDDIPAAEDDGKKAGDDSKKSFQRVWSEDDEIALLEGMAEFSAKNRVHPYRDINAFHDFIKKSLHADVSNEQLSNKIRRLKKKYQTIDGRNKNGLDPRLWKLHDKKAFELSKKIWATEGENGGLELLKSNGKDGKDGKHGKKQKGSNNTLPSLKPKAELHSKEVIKIDIDQNASSSLSLSEMIRFDKSLGLSGLGEDVIKRGFELIGISKRAELEDRWKKLQVAELELFVKRAGLIQDQATLIWEAHKSSSN